MLSLCNICPTKNKHRPQVNSGSHAPCQFAVIARVVSPYAGPVRSHERYLQSPTAIPATTHMQRRHIHEVQGCFTADPDAGAVYHSGGLRCDTRHQCCVLERYAAWIKSACRVFRPTTHFFRLATYSCRWISERCVSGCQFSGEVDVRLDSLERYVLAILRVTDLFSWLDIVKFKLAG